MKINLKELSKQAVETTGTNVKKMRMSANAQTEMFKIFTSRIYSNPIGTVVREITSNCFDSHIEAKVNSPVIVRHSFEKEANSHYISFIDFGVGMCPDRVENIYGVYFESTKNTSDDQIGGFGIGGKTPLAYKRRTGLGEDEYDNSFYVITIFNGTKYYYNIYEGSDSPVINLLHSESTTERNGTEIRVPVLEKDLNAFKKEMVKQLYYFENIIFENFENDNGYGTDYGEILNENYQIVRGKNFLFRGNEYSDYMHVCLGKVAYPLNYDILELSMNEYKIPIALRLEIGDVGVTQSREALDYSEKTIKLLKKKIESAKDEIVQLIAKQYDNIVTLEDYFKAKTQFGYLYFPNDESIYVGNLIKLKDVDFSNFKYSFMKMPDDAHLFRFMFESKMYGKKVRRRNRYKTDAETYNGGYEGLTKNDNLYFIEGEFERKIVKQAYLKAEHERYYIISKRNIVSKFLMSEVSEIFNVHDALVTDDGKGNVQPTKYALSLVDLQNEYFELVKKYAKDYDALVVPQDFIDNRKFNREKLSQDILNSTVPVRIMGSWGSTRIQLKSLFDLNVPVYYGTKENEIELQNARKLYETLFTKSNLITDYREYNNSFTYDKKKGGLLILMLAKNNVKYMDYCKKAYPISEFKTRMVHRKADAVVEYFQTYNLVEKYYSIQELYRSKEFSKLSTDWGKKIAKLNKFITKINSSNKNWSKEKQMLSLYYPITNTKTTKEQDAFVKIIDELKEMQELNADTLRYINLPYRLENTNDVITNDVIWNILKKVLVY